MKLTELAAARAPKPAVAQQQFGCSVDVRPKPNVFVGDAGDFREADGVRQMRIVPPDGGEPEWVRVPEGAKTYIRDAAGGVDIAHEDLMFVITVVSASTSPGGLVLADGRPRQSVVPIGQLSVGIRELAAAHARAERGERPDGEEKTS